MRRRMIWLLMCIGVPFCAWIGWRAADTSAAAPPGPTRTISQYGITWTSEGEPRVGQFVNGDYYVVGPTTVVEITPRPADGRNGSVLNLPPDGRAGFDDRTRGSRYDESQVVQLPIRMKPGDSLISTISVEKFPGMKRMLRESDNAVSPVQTAAVLTCLAEPAPPDAFRPSYCDTSNRLYLAGDLRRELLPSLPRVESTPILAKWERVFQRPWIETGLFHFIAPVENMPQYGREEGRAVGIAALLLCSDFTPAEKEKLLINFVQLGIDLWGVVRAGHPGWPAHGGHGSGRKWPIVFAGIMLGDEQMQSPAATYPDLKLGEDIQTMYGKGWTGATALYAGHVGEGGHPQHNDWGPYEHLHPSEWPGRIGESYRRCCTSVCWIGQALAVRILHAESIWDHDAFLDYCDRWMTEDDTEHIKIIQETRDWDFSQSWSRQGQAWDEFVNDMWATYRNNLPPARDADG